MTAFLGVWTAIAFCWWAVALVLLARGSQRRATVPLATRLSLTVFKPLPPVVDETERAALAIAVNSFVEQLRPYDDLVVGMDVADSSGWQPALQSWRASRPEAQIRVVLCNLPSQCANPKVAWLQVMVPSAKGELWLWTDADVIAPSGFLDEICARLLEGQSHAVTAGCKVQNIRQPQGIFDALFVNVEFLPGALLLGRMGRQNFAYGAATVFRAQTFQARVDWKVLGSSLADDHVLGEFLQPVSLANTLVSTMTKPTGWAEAWQHYYRWQKTVRWCCASGFAGLLVLMPALGWAIAAHLGGLRTFYVLGLVTVLGAEMVVAVLACRLLGCRLPPATWVGVMLWPVLRPATWLLVWLPLPAVWTGRKRAWFAPRQE